MPHQTRPKIKIYDFGGTITSTDGEGGPKYGGVAAEDLIKRYPWLEKIAQIECETVFTGGSPDLTDEILLPAIRHINEDLATGLYVAGLAIIGTDLTGDTMTLLSITINPWHPFGVTGAIRRLTDLSADGEINLHNTACLVISPEAKDRGVMYVSQNYVFEALSVIKVSTTSVNAFEGIKIGEIRGIKQYFYYSPERRRHSALCDIANRCSLPRVIILYGHLDQDETLFEYATSRVRGIVLAGSGAGSWTTKGGNIMQRLKNEGKDPIVVVSFRTATGLVTEKYGLPSWTISAGDNSPARACVLLRAFLAPGFDATAIRRVFDAMGRTRKGIFKSRL